MKVFMEHIPRTIFGVKFNRKLNDGSFMYNDFQIHFKKNHQLKAYDRLVNDAEHFSEVKMIRWHINANDEEVTKDV